MACGVSFTSSSVLGFARPRSNGGDNGEWISAKALATGEIPRDERELETKISWNPTFSSPAVMEVVRFSSIIFS